MVEMRLCDFIRANEEPIIKGWEEFARSLPSAHHLGIEALHDHVVDMLQAIADDLDCVQTADEQAEKSKGRSSINTKESKARRHGAAREKAGFHITEEISEFRALRANILRLWIESDSTVAETTSNDLIRFNEAIDQMLAESTEKYSERTGRFYDTLLSSSPDPSYIFSLDGEFIYVNKSLANLYGKSPNEIIGKTIIELGAVFASELQRQLQYVIDSKVTCRAEISSVFYSGTELTYDYLLVPVLDMNGNVEAITGTARDVTERKASEEEVRRRANYDSLTGLPNRSFFHDRLEWEVKRSERTGLPIALFFIDLDDFKEINDQLGHDAGDHLLQQAAQRINSCVRGTDTVARLGGDEFTVILTEVNRVQHVEILAREILEELARSFLILQKPVHISASIGITLFPQDATTPEKLIRNADQAMYVAKNAGRNRFSFFTLAMRDAAWVRLKVIDELRQALSQQQLSLYYQPIIDLSTGAIVKAEALLRWQHPQIGLMLPGEFVGLAEEAGLIGEIDQWVMNEAVAHARKWSQLLGAPFQVSINKSLVDFISKVPIENRDSYLAALELAGNNISVEITEEMLLNDSPTVIERLGNIKKAGIQLAIDDFGIGYSSMIRLKRFEVNYLKIDQSFVQGLTTNLDSRVITETIIVMAHKLGLKVIAEGVETPEQRDWLKAAECDYGQGYYFSAPVSAQDFEQLLSVGKIF